nr:MAG: hypothetical protein [Bacteriophage sp.]
MTIKQVRFVKADSRNPVQDIAELAVFDASGNPVDPPTSLADGSVTTVKLADDAVTSAKIKDGSIIGSALADGSVTTVKLADDAVTSAKIKDGSISGSDLADNTVTATKIASGVLPTNATKEKAGLVKQAAHVNDPAGETPTKAEFIALRDALVAAGQMASA